MLMIPITMSSYFLIPVTLHDKAQPYLSTYLQSHACVQHQVN